MKIILVYLLLATCVANGHHTKKIVIKTRSTDRVYNFFPLKSNMLMFLVKASHDVHIVFTQDPVFAPPYYEVVFGAYSNTKSILRKDNDEAQKQAAGAHVRANQFAYYWASINDRDKTISAGTDGKVLLKFTDKNFVPMHYFGISTGFGSEGEWHFSADNISKGVRDGVFSVKEAHQ